MLTKFLFREERLENLLEKLENDNNFKRDPNDLVMIERNDFTNYLVFYDEFKSNDFLLEKLFEFNPDFKSQSSDQKEEQRKHCLRYLYTVIFEVYTTNFELEGNEISEKIKQKEEEQKFAGNIFEDPNLLPKNVHEKEKKEEETEKNDKNEKKAKGETIEHSPEKEEGKKMEWEIDDKLLIFSWIFWFVPCSYIF